MKGLCPGATRFLLPLEWEQDKGWADGFGEQIRSILQRNVGQMVSVRSATDDEDAQRATDLVVTLDTGDVALRVRRDDCRFRDLTLRYRRRPWGALEHPFVDGYEVDKIIEGYARWYLYLWTAGSTVKDWLLVDLDVVRAARLIEAAVENGRERENTDRVTTFTWLELGELSTAGAVVATTLDEARAAA